jgi:hypothetical protein
MLRNQSHEPCVSNVMQVPFPFVTSHYIDVTIERPLVILHR